MPDTATFLVHMDYSGHLYFKLKDDWTSIGGAPTYNGARLHPAHVDDNNHLVYRFQGVWQRSNGTEASFKEKPLQLFADAIGTLYALHNGELVTPSPSPTT